MSLMRTDHLEQLREARIGAADGVPDASSRVVVSAGDGGPVAIPDAALLRDGAFLREGGDLVIRGPGGAEVVVQGYFASRPTLTNAAGDVALGPGLVDSFLSAMAPGQYAQAAVAAAQTPIGQVDDLKGEAFAVRADGTRVQLAKGDPVFEGDIVETGGGASAIRMVFLDKTMFALGSDARLALDKLVFDPSQLSGSSQFSILKGVFIFSSGEIAKTDNTDMTVITPVAAIGIRGTEVAGRVDGANSQFTIIDGAIEVTTQAGSVTLDGAGETTLVSGINAPPSEPFILSPAEYAAAYGGVAGVAPAYFSAGGHGTDAPGSEDDGAPDFGSDGVDDHARASGGTGSGTRNSQAAEGGATAAPERGGETAWASNGSVPDAVADLAREISETVEYQLATALTFEPVPDPTGAGGSTGAADDDRPGSSPFRTESDAPDVFWNPYVPSEPYGAVGPAPENDASNTATGDPAGSVQDAVADNGGYAEEPSPQGGTAAADEDVTLPPASPAPPLPASIVLSVSNAIDTTDFASQDRTDSFELTDLGPDSSVTVLGSEMALPGVAAGAAVDVTRDSAGNVDVALTSPWNAFKNIYAVSDRAADISITNFVHADLEFGGGGDSHIVLDGVKRGFIMTGDGDDLVDITAFTNIDTWSRRIDVSSGDGDDTVLYEGSSSYFGVSTLGLSELTFTAGSGTDTLRLTGPDQAFDLTAPRFDITGVERVDITSAVDRLLSLDAVSVAAITDGENALTGSAETLVVDGGAGDRIDFNGEVWSQSGSTTIEGESYTIYEHSSGVRVAADQDIALA